MKRTILLFLTTLLLCGCVRHIDSRIAPSPSPQGKTLTRTAEAPNASDPAEKDAELITRDADDPWRVCADGAATLSIATVDALTNEEYRRRVQITLNIQDSEAAGVTVISRCLNGALYVCNASADQRCMKKLNAEPEVNEAMATACAKEELDGVILPDSITDANAAFEWTCRDGKPSVTAQLCELDAMGFIKEIWKEIPAP